MLRLDRAARRAFVALILLAIIQPRIASAQIPGLGQEGWHTWQIEAVESAPHMCCFSWRLGTVTKKQCDLDGRNGGFTSSDGNAFPDDAVQVFALMREGEIVKIRALSASCPVTSKSAIKDLGPIETDDSVEWLKDVANSRGDKATDAIAAIAVHKGTKARDALIDAAQVDNDEDIREDAIFWMGQVRIGETAGTVKDFLFNDRDPDIREHAAFSYSQSDAPDVAEVLIRQGRDDRDPDVRSQAWFWLAQTEAAESEDAIRHALFNDRDEDVREEAVFALAQLPEDRAVQALAEILQDRKLSMDIREKALFWLAQTESDEAFEYIDRLLGDNQKGQQR